MKFMIKKVRHVHICYNLKGRVLFIQCLGTSVISISKKISKLLYFSMNAKFRQEKKKGRRRRRRSVNPNKVHMQAT